MSILPNFAIIGIKWNFISYPQLDFSKKCDKIKHITLLYNTKTQYAFN